jgi:hypothetical protein
MKDADTEAKGKAAEHKLAIDLPLVHVPFQMI